MNRVLRPIGTHPRFLAVAAGAALLLLGTFALARRPTASLERQLVGAWTASTPVIPAVFRFKADRTFVQIHKWGYTAGRWRCERDCVVLVDDFSRSGPLVKRIVSWLGFDRSRRTRRLSLRFAAPDRIALGPTADFEVETVWRRRTFP